MAHRAQLPQRGIIEDTCFPGWDFQDMSTWTGALLGNGGVAWGKLFDKPNASYGVHNGNVTFCEQRRARLPAHIAVIRAGQQDSGPF